MSTGLGQRILVVDDDASTRNSLEILLNRAGYQVIQAPNGAEATRLWREAGGDLVILDLFMPEKDGIETILELRAHSPGVRIIAMSGGGEKQRVDVLGHAKLLGAVLTIKKPFTQAEMMTMVDRALK
ncbi:MAG: response regulator [Gemmatimonadales bacterium]